MKKIVMFGLVVLLLVGAVKLATHHYEMSGTVVEDKGSTITVKTTNGHEWLVNVDPFVFQEGDEVIVKFAESGNPNRQGDDKIVDIYKK